jgi:hypothetical protein
MASRVELPVSRQSDTPLTDDATCWHRWTERQSPDCPNVTCQLSYVEVDFARQLERDRAMLADALAGLLSLAERHGLQHYSVENALKALEAVEP